MPQNGSDNAEPLYYYCLRQGQEVAKLIATRNNGQLFTSKAKKLFADKPLLVEMIENKTYTWYHVQTVGVHLQSQHAIN